MTIASAKNTPRNTYTATGGQTVFTIGFEFFSATDIKVFRNGTALTFNAAPSSVAQFSVQGTTNASDSAYEFGAGGTITLGGGATADDSIVIVRDITVERLTDFTPAASFDVTALNTQLDTLMAMMAEREESASRSIRLPLAETTTGFDMQLPVKASRANKILEFDADGDPQCAITATNLSTLGTITSDITTVAGISANVTTVAGISSNVTTVAGKASEITSVAAKASLITSDFVSDLNTLAVTDVVNDINTLATSDIVSDLNTLATSDIVSDINTLATSDIVSDLNTLAMSDIVTDLNLLATSDNVTNMATLGASGVVSNIASVAGSIANVNTTASNISGVNSFAARYRVASSDPGSDNDAGDLVFNTTSNILKVYNGSAFEDVTGSTLAGLSDTNITSPADGSILLYDTGTSKYIDNVISGDATLADTGALTIADDAITSAKIADDAITTALIADNAITNALMTDNAIDTAEIAASAVETAKINDGAVTTDKLGADAVTAAKIADDAISEEHLDPTVISGLADTTIAAADHVMFHDATDNALKKVDAGELLGGGKIKQITHATDATLYSISVTNSTSDHAGSIAYSITPSSSSHKIMIHFTIPQVKHAQHAGLRVRLYRQINGGGYSHVSGLDGTAASPKQGALFGNYDTNGDGNRAATIITGTVVDSPSTTTQVDYKFYFGAGDGATTIFVNRTQNDANFSYTHRTRTHVTLVEFE